MRWLLSMIYLLIVSLLILVRLSIVLLDAVAAEFAYAEQVTKGID